MKKDCEKCEFYSHSLAVCFHPNAWTMGETHYVPGNPLLINRDGNCQWYDDVRPAVYPVGLWGKLRRFFRPWKVRITK